MKLTDYHSKNIYRIAALHNDFLQMHLIAENCIKSLMDDKLSEIWLMDMEAGVRNLFIENLVKIHSISDQSRRLCGGVGILSKKVSAKKWSNFVDKVDKKLKANSQGTRKEGDEK